MSESHEPKQDERRAGYEPPYVERIDTEDEPAVVAAGNNTVQR